MPPAKRSIIDGLKHVRDSIFCEGTLVPMNSGPPKVNAGPSGLTVTRQSPGWTTRPPGAKTVRDSRDSIGKGWNRIVSAPSIGDLTVDDPDGPLVRAIAQGNQDAARQLVERHLSKIVSLALRMLGNRDDAEDVAQEVFLRVWTNAQKWQPGKARFETWMYRVAINLCYDKLRRNREVLVKELPEPIDEAPNPAETLQRSQVAQRVDQAVSELPARQRVAITLCHYQELGNIEAAEIMDVSVEALESLLARGRRTLGKKLLPERENLLGQV